MKTILDIDLNTLDQMSLDLGKKIRQSGFAPDHVLYVERAGLLPGAVLAEYFGTGISSVFSRRSGTGAKSRAKTLLKHLPRWATHGLRRLELASSVHGAKPERQVGWDRGLPLSASKILMVDDAVDTGHSLKSIIHFLKKEGVETQNLRVAVLTTTGTDPVVRADYSLMDQTICAFPWSYDSREYEAAQAKMNTLRTGMAGRTEKSINNPRPASATAFGL